MNVSILTGALFLLPVFAAAQEPVLSTDRAIAEIAAGREDDALATVVALLGKSATDQTLHRARVNLLLALERPGPAMVCARLFANALPQGLERASLEVFADRSLAFYRSMESPALLTRLGALRAEGNPARMLAIVRVLEGRVDEGREKPRRILGEFYGSNHRFFDRRKAVAYLTGYRKTATDRRERIEIYQRLLTLENGQKLKVVVPVSSSGSVEKRVLAELAAGDNEVAFKSVQSLLAKDPTNPELLRVQMNLQLGLGHQMDAIESARDLADALPKGLERTSLQAVASLAASMYERMPSSDIFERLDVQRRRRDPARMVAMIRVLEARVDAKRDPPCKVIGEFYGCDNEFYDRKKAIANLTRYLETVRDPKERVDLYKALMVLEKGGKLSAIVRSVTDTMPTDSPAIQEIHALLAEAERARVVSVRTNSRESVTKALSSPLERALRLTSKLEGDDARYVHRLRSDLRVPSRETIELAGTTQPLGVARRADQEVRKQIPGGTETARSRLRDEDAECSCRYRGDTRPRLDPRRMPATR